MPCPSPTGACSQAADGTGCTAAKTSGVLAGLNVTAVQGTADGITITWDITTSYADQIVRLLVRDRQGTTYFLGVADRDTGTITATGLTAGEELIYRIRPENDTVYDIWIAGEGLADVDWDSTMDFVNHRGQQVEHLTDPIIH